MLPIFFQFPITIANSAACLISSGSLQPRQRSSTVQPAEFQTTLLNTNSNAVVPLPSGAGSLESLCVSALLALLRTRPGDRVDRRLCVAFGALE